MFGSTIVYIIVSANIAIRVETNFIHISKGVRARAHTHTLFQIHMVGRDSYYIRARKLRWKEPPPFGTCLPNQLFSTKSTSSFQTTSKRLAQELIGIQNRSNSQRTLANFYIPRLQKEVLALVIPAEVPNHRRDDDRNRSRYVQDMRTSLNALMQSTDHFINSIDYQPKLPST